MRSGDLFLEVSSSNQATALIKLQKLAHLDLTVAPHSTLNFSRGVISPADFLNVSTEEIKENMKAQKSDSPRKPKSRRARQRDLKPHLTRIPKKLSRDFHRKIEEDTLTGDRSEDDEDLMDIQSGPSTSSECGTIMTAFISWNCRGLRTRLDDLKSIISTYQPACVALQETFLKSTMTMQVRGYNCVRRDVDGATSPTGGVCLFTSNLYPSTVVTLHTSLQAVAVRIHIHSLVTVCCVYLPPNDVVPQVDLNQLVSQLPAPFILLGDFNGHSPLWGHDDTNSRGRQIELLISDHCLCLLNNDEKTYFHAPTRTFHSLDLAICSPTLLPMLNFEVANDLHNSDHFPLLVSHVNGTGVRNCPPTYRFHCADWNTFTQLLVITGIMVQDGTINDAVIVTHASCWKKLCVGDQQILRIHSHSSRREYGSNICDSRIYNTEECCSGYT
ncbi:putative RNA-directed DNA polymerase from transposon X-element [Trichonephila clavipes]|nr:putative RNA-directed DNA polymerase from transposon X-element [Trichonephila clavipes]